MSKLKFAVIGAGHIGKRHAEMIDKNPEAVLVAVCDIRSKESCGFQQNVPFYSSASEMLGEMDIDVVCVCTPNGLHAEHSILALQNKNHVVVEKPIALTKLDCEKISHSSKVNDRLVCCVMQNRYSPPSVWLKELVTQKVLGKIYMVQINCYWNRDERYYDKVYWKGTKDLDGGVLFTQFSHFIDIMYWLFGDVKNIQARFADFNHQHNTEFEDSGIVNFDFVNEGLGSINFSTAVNNRNYESGMTIIAEKGTIKVGGQYMNEIEYCDVEGYDKPEFEDINPANDYGHYKGSAANHHFIIENVIDAIKGRAEITTNVDEGLKVVDIVERIYASSDRGLKNLNLA